MRKVAFALVTIAVVASGLALSPEVQAACSPRPCHGPDAAITGVSVPSTTVTGHTFPFVVKGVNRGNRGTWVRTTTATNDGVTDPNHRDTFVRAHQAFSVTFNYRPVRPRRRAAIAACTRAVPNDVDRSNCCAIAFTQVKKQPTFR